MMDYAPPDEHTQCIWHQQLPPLDAIEEHTVEIVTDGRRFIVDRQLTVQNRVLSGEVVNQKLDRVTVLVCVVVGLYLDGGGHLRPLC